MAKSQTFEEMIEELESIVETLEKGEIPLDESVTLFEKGVKLSGKCHSRLDKAEQKITMLTENEDGTVTASAFEGEEK